MSEISGGGGGEVSEVGSSGGSDISSGPSAEVTTQNSSELNPPEGSGGGGEVKPSDGKTGDEITPPGGKNEEITSPGTGTTDEIPPPGGENDVFMTQEEHGVGGAHEGTGVQHGDGPTGGETEKTGETVDPTGSEVTNPTGSEVTDTVDPNAQPLSGAEVDSTPPAGNEVTNPTGEEVTNPTGSEVTDTVDPNAQPLSGAEVDQTPPATESVTPTDGETVENPEGETTNADGVNGQTTEDLVDNGKELNLDDTTDTTEGDSPQLNNTEKNIDGEPLEGEAKQINEQFRGDQFKKEDSFDSKVDSKEKKALTDSNAKAGGEFEGTLKDPPAAPKELTAKDKANLEKLKGMRDAGDTDDANTVMQKVLTPDAAQRYINNGEHATTVGGCCSKAKDAAPYTGNPEAAYKNLRLDYNNGDGTNPFKTSTEIKEPMYVMRFTTDTAPNQMGVPNAGAPCSGTGFTAAKDNLIPEYSASGQSLTGGAIYQVDGNGKETMIAYFDSDNMVWETVGSAKDFS